MQAMHCMLHEDRSMRCNSCGNGVSLDAVIKNSMHASGQEMDVSSHMTFQIQSHPISIPKTRHRSIHRSRTAAAAVECRVTHSVTHTVKWMNEHSTRCECSMSQRCPQKLSSLPKLQNLPFSSAGSLCSTFQAMLPAPSSGEYCAFG